MIRTARPDDAHQIQRLITLGIGGSTPKDASWITARVSSKTGIVLVDVEGTHIVGAIVGQIVADEAEIHDVVVHVENRRAGRGQNLVTHFEDHAHSMGADQIFLEVRTDNYSAIGLYEKLQYKSTAHRPSYYTDGQDATVAVVGCIDRNQTSLTPGQQYFVQKDGTLALTAATPSVVAGTAISATELVVKE